jgi:hypothetical protein
MWTRRERIFSVDIPKVGDKIYVPTTLYVTHGMDDFIGGICTVAGVRLNDNPEEGVAFVSIEEEPGQWYNWDTYLAPNQEIWKAEFGDQTGHLQPDPRPEFNEESDEPWS